MQNPQTKQVILKYGNKEKISENISKWTLSLDEIKSLKDEADLVLRYYPTLKEMLDAMEFHAEQLVLTKGERKGSLEIRKHLVQYIKSFP